MDGWMDGTDALLPFGTKQEEVPYPRSIILA